MNPLLWQLIDSGFPSGGFAHSSGLEAAVHHGIITDGDGVRAFTRQSLAQCGRAAMPLVRAAHQDIGDLGELDQLCDVFLSNPIANRASRAQGRALLTTSVRSFGGSRLAELDALVRNRRLIPHHAPIFGALMNALDIRLDDTLRAFLFLTVRGVTSAAVRLGLVGAYEAQNIQAGLIEDVESVMSECRGLAPADIAQTAPLIDLLQSTHDRLYSRLFQS